MTFAPAKFEVATSNSLEEDASTRKYIIWPWPSSQGHTKCCSVPSTSCDLCTYRDWSYYIKSFRRRSIYKKTQYLTFDLDPGVKVTQNVAQYPLHHVTYPATKFEVARSNRLGGDTFTRKYIIWSLTLGSRSHKMFPSNLYIMWLFSYKVWSCYVKRLRRRCIYKKIQYLTLTGSKSHKMLPSTLYIMWPIQLQSLRLLRLTV